MILIDTHIWYWWVSDHPRLTVAHRTVIESNIDTGLGLSIISCWEVAKKASLGKLALDRPIDVWINAAIQAPGLNMLSLTPDVVLDAVSLPDGFRSDPADELLIATSRVLGIPFLTADAKIINYKHVNTIPA